MTTAMTSEILTYGQVVMKESYAAVNITMNKHKIEVDAAIDAAQDLDCECYFVNDGKMSYLQTQYSLHNRKGHPFFQCSCRRSQMTPCVMMSKERAIELYDVSEQHFGLTKSSWPMKKIKDYKATKNRDKLLAREAKTSKMKKKKCPKWLWKETRMPLKDIIAMHRTWCDLHNEGITHFGLHPSRWNLVENSRPDVFHLRSGITRKIVHYLRMSVSQYGKRAWDGITLLLSKIWRPYFMDQWHKRKPMNRLQGTHIFLFL